MSVVDLIAASAQEVASLLKGGSPSERSITWDDIAWGSGARKTATGKTVSQETAVQMIAVWACVSLISDAMSSTPLKTYRVGDAGQLEQIDNLSWVTEPNTDMSPYEFWTRSMTSVLLDGNTFYYIARGRKGISELIPLHPSDVQVDIDRRTMRRSYSLAGKPMSRRELLHVPGFVLPGDGRALSPIAAAKEAVGLGFAAEEFGARFFANGASMSGVVETPGNMNPDQAQVMARTFAKKHSGVENSHLPGVLTGGAQWKPVTVPPEQAQFLQTRKFQTTEIARLYRVPPHLIGDVEKSTSWGSGIEEQNRGYLQFTLQPWVTRFEQAMSSLAPEGIVVRFDMNEILRGTKKERYETYNIGVGGGWILPDEARAEEGLAPLPDGAGAHPRPAPNESPDSGGETEAPAQPAPEDEEERGLELRHPGHEDQSSHGKWAHGNGDASVSDGDAARLAGAAGEPDGGFTFNPREGADVTTGYAVSGMPERTLQVAASDLTPAHIQGFVEQNGDVFNGDTNNMLGGWHNPDNGNVYLDVVSVTSSKSAAAAIGVKYNQISMMNLDTFEVIPLGGTGEA